MMSVAESWNRIITWHEKNTHSDFFPLNEGASLEEIDKFEHTIDLALPEDFRESLLLHNGGDGWILWYGDLLSLNSMTREWREKCKWQEEEGYGTEEDDWIPTFIEGPIKPIFWNPDRIFITDNCGDHLTLDLDPPEDGHRGQIYDHSHEVGPSNVLASSWAEFLSQFAEDLENGKYVYIEEEETVALPGMYD